MPTITTRPTTDLEYLLDVCKVQAHIIEAVSDELTKLTLAIHAMGSMIEEPARNHLTRSLDGLSTWIEENAPGV